jgi:aromatic-L-amino-acid decarboxylase
MPVRENPLEPTADEMRSIAQGVLDLLVDNIKGLDLSPASLNSPSPALLAEVSQPPPEASGDIGVLLDRVCRAAEQSYQTAGPGYLAYIPGGGIFTSALAGFLAEGLNRYTGKVTTAPALVAMEESVLRWMCDLFDFPIDAQALLTSGGSMANLIAVTTARTLHAEGQVDRATVYVGEHAHGSIAKAARIAGISREHVRTVRSSSDLRLDVSHLKVRLEEDRDAGLIPVCICAAAGTTNTGTIDALGEVAAIARDFGVWFHVDGAYGGLFQLTDRGRKRLAGIELADSITLDPHKALFLPFGTGAIVVRSRDALRRTFSEAADYMQDLDEESTLPDFDALSPELSREFRGLRLWLPLHLHGVDAFRQQLDEKFDLAASAYETLSANHRLEVPWVPDLTVLVFRLKGGDDAAQLRFLDRINKSQRVLLSSTRIGGSVYLRIAILSVRTHADRVREALEIISTAAGTD